MCSMFSMKGEPASDQVGLVNLPFPVMHRRMRLRAQVLLRWNVQRGVAVIPKASSPEHMRANIEGLFDWRLSYNQKVQEDRA